MENKQGQARIHLISGHYGSGKTEFALNYALRLRQDHQKVAIVDLDIVNLYFRSREYEDMLAAHDIQVFGSSVKGSQVDLPALAANIQMPLQDAAYQVVVDLGGNPVGARVLGYYRDVLEGRSAELLFVVNRHRPETSNLKDTEVFMQDIARLARMPVSALVNTTHLLKETTVQDILYGQELCEAIRDKYDIPIRYIACRSEICDKLPENLDGEVFPLKIFMRADWML
ncbi:ATP-binding protein [Peptococcus simiae]|uniref:ATP-binding protein n=1 Tax=Peptococcus simiae TaxID=1643805 RepID=A0ABW9GZW6_9FIRM